jgi:hypothetical protein
MFKENFTFLTGILLVWAIISGIGFAVIGWNYLENTVFQNGVDAGAQTGFQNGLKEGAAAASGQIYTDIINKSANNDCNTVFVQYEGRRVDLINVKCLELQAPATDANGAAATVPNS